MRKFFPLLLLPGPVQTCVHNDLSASLTLTTSVRRLRPVAGSLDSCVVAVTVSDRQQRRPPQTIRFTSDHLYTDTYRNCEAARSYATGKNQTAAAPDNDYGDLIVADFNFDGRDDFAAKADVGGNGGPFYRYYLQQPSGQFALNSFLTEEMQYFPARFDARRHTLTTLVHANARELCEIAYQVDGRTDAWRRISRRWVPYSATSR